MPPTTTDHDATLRQIFRDHVRGKPREQLLPGSVLEDARAAYRLVDDDHKRAAWWAFRGWGVTLDEQAPAPVRAIFVLSEDAPDAVRAVGFDAGERWNGWACPLVDHDGAEEFCKAMARYDGSGMSYRWDRVTDQIVQRDDSYPDDPHSVAPYWTEALGQNLFNLGSPFGLCWMVDEDRTAALDALRLLIAVIGPGFHLDTSGDNYTPETLADVDGGAEFIDSTVAAALDALAFTDPYRVTLDIMTELFPAHFE